MSQFDGMDRRSPSSCKMREKYLRKTITRWERRLCYIFTLIIRVIINGRQLFCNKSHSCWIFCLGVLSFHHVKLNIAKYVNSKGWVGVGGVGGIKHQTLRCSRLVRKRRIAFPSAQMESDIWERGKIQLEAGVFLHVCRKKTFSQHKRRQGYSLLRAGSVSCCCLCILYFYGENIMCIYSLLKSMK